MVSPTNSCTTRWYWDVRGSAWRCRARRPWGRRCAFRRSPAASAPASRRAGAEPSVSTWIPRPGWSPGRHVWLLARSCGQFPLRLLIWFLKAPFRILWHSLKVQKASWRQVPSRRRTCHLTCQDHDPLNNVHQCIVTTKVLSKAWASCRLHSNRNFLSKNCFYRD